MIKHRSANLMSRAFLKKFVRTLQGVFVVLSSFEGTKLIHLGTKLCEYCTILRSVLTVRGQSHINNKSSIFNPSPVSLRHFPSSLIMAQSQTPSTPKMTSSRPDPQSLLLKFDYQRPGLSLKSHGTLKTWTILSYGMSLYLFGTYLLRFVSEILSREPRMNSSCHYTTQPTVLRRLQRQTPSWRR